MVDTTAVGAATPPIRRSWTSTDAILYALGVGAGTAELSFTTENSHDHPQQVLPTFSVIIGSTGKSLGLIGEFDSGRLVHGSQATTVYSPIPVDGTIEVVERISGIQDKGPGKHAIIEMSSTGYDVATGKLLIESTATAVLRGQGGFGGSPGASAELPVPPSATPGIEVSYPTTAETPLIYRLSGDRNPLHSDPWFAQHKAGFETPIMHGLCTYGFAGRALLHSLCDGDPRAFGAMSARFAAPAYPGEVLTTSIWPTADGAYFHTTGTSERVVLSGGQFRYRRALSEPLNLPMETMRRG
jgi:acyl dehydratase